MKRIKTAANSRWANLIEQINAKGASFVSLKENVDTSTPQGRLYQQFFVVMQNINGLPKNQQNTHVLRHTYLTYLAAAGLDVKTLQSIAGHNDTRTTMNRYVHPQKENIRRAGALVDKMLD